MHATHMPLEAYIHADNCVRIHNYKQTLSLHTCNTYLCKHTYIHVKVHAYTLQIYPESTYMQHKPYINTSTHLHTHTHTHTHKHTGWRKCSRFSIVRVGGRTNVKPHYQFKRPNKGFLHRDTWIRAQNV
jgi:hypothetical protein